MPEPAAFAPWRGVFETLRVEAGCALFAAEHEAELQRAAAALGLSIDASQLRTAPPLQTGRWRWIVTSRGTETLFQEETFSAMGPISLAVSPVRVGSHNWDARFKTLSYLTHEQAGESVTTGEAVLLNERGDVASASRGNIFWRRGDVLFTPAHETGCRCGVVRQFVLQRRDVREDQLALAELLAADEIFLTNSLRGIVSVGTVEGNERSDFSTADALRNEYAAEVARQIAMAPTTKRT
jgi:branched-subunit amino acid aminotransferase/4-amino-4-deoxychorismate lyase